MSRQLMIRLLLCVFSIATAASLGGCSKAEQTKSAETQSRNEPSTAPATSPPQFAAFASPSPGPAAKQSPPPPPKPNEIREAVARVFESAAAPDLNRHPVVGDFNGDGSEDIAVVVRPNDSALPEVNSEVANWTLEDPKKVFVPGRDTAPRPPGKPVRAEKGDILLAIIHGVGASGWRNPQAKQTYLLKNGVGGDMATESFKNLRNSKDKQKLPQIRGDAVRVKIEGEAGMIFWTGAKYAWYSLGSE